MTAPLIMHEVLADAAPALVDPFGRRVSYLRVSVTDRCDLRCTYCMSEHMTFLPKADLLTLDELDRVCSAFVDLGVRKLRLTGGEPLVRKNVMWLVERLSRHLSTGALDELTLTTNATQLHLHAQRLADLGVRRVNVSLDTLDPAAYARITRGGNLAQTLRGVTAAQAAGIRIKINAVALKRDNARDIPHLITWAHEHDCDVSLIETMPMGDTGEDRRDQFLSLTAVREELSTFWTLEDLPDQSGGPARYVRIRETGGKLGLITPLTHNFCAACNRVRLTCTGVLYMCLGQQDCADLRPALRHARARSDLNDAIREAISRKPERHDFDIARLSGPSVVRHMSMTGG